MQRGPNLLIDRLVGDHDVAPDVVALPGSVQAPVGLLEQLKAPRQAEPDDVVAAVLEVEPVPGGSRVQA